MRLNEAVCALIYVSLTHYCGSTGDVFYLIPLKKYISIPGIPLIDVVAIYMLFFLFCVVAISI